MSELTDNAVASITAAARVACEALQGAVESAVAQSYADQLAATNLELTQTLDALETKQTQLEVLQAKYDAYVAAHPAAVRTLFGACAGSGSPSTAVSVVTTKYPAAGIVRIFAGAPAALAVSSVVNHISYSCPIAVTTSTGTKTVFDCAGVLAGKYDAGITAAAKAAKAGDVLTLKHEPEDDISRGEFTVANYVAAWARFQGLVKAANPGVLTCLVLMGWTFMAASGRNPDAYAGIKADLLGIDLDDPKQTYPDWTEAVTKATAWAKAHGMGWCVPEFNGLRDTTDTTGAKRAAYLTDWTSRFHTAGAHSVCLYDFNIVDKTTLKIVTAWALPNPSPELTTWRALT